jgi:CHAD domain-containing protein
VARPRKIEGSDPDTRFITFLRRLILLRHHEMMSHCEGAASGDPEAVHDMRVASRRLRAALLLGREIFPARRRFRRFERSIRDLTDDLGHVRDLDVLLDYLESDRLKARAEDGPHLDRMIAHVDGRRVERRITMNESLNAFGQPRREARFESFFAQDSKRKRK